MSEIWKAILDLQQDLASQEHVDSEDVFARLLDGKVEEAEEKVPHARHMAFIDSIC